MSPPRAAGNRLPFTPSKRIDSTRAYRSRKIDYPSATFFNRSRDRINTRLLTTITGNWIGEASGNLIRYRFLLTESTHQSNKSSRAKASGFKVFELATHGCDGLRVTPEYRFCVGVASPKDQTRAGHERSLQKGVAWWPADHPLILRGSGSRYHANIFTGHATSATGTRHGSPWMWFTYFMQSDYAASYATRNGDVTL